MLCITQAALRAWQNQEEERERLQQEIARKLKEERVEQLEDKHTRRQRVSRFRQKSFACLVTVLILGAPERLDVA